jgi:hypothetical protein
VTPKEQEIAIGELEERVDRLRNIYEQYFLGFEKLEPTVPKKDVDRRFQILRKEQIRNTAMRFRFQVVTQKFNTYSMHWVRICRQIEEGTYKRHVRKAKARFGDGPRGAADNDVSIDIEMGDFDDADMDAVLAEADASVASHHRDAPDTVPPAAPAPSAPPPSVRGLADRAQRGAALPAGTKPRIILRKRDDTEPPPSVRSLQAAPPSSPVIPGPPSNPRLPSAPGASAPRIPAASSSQLPVGSTPRLPAQSRPYVDIAGGRPSGPRIVRSGSGPDSVPGLSSATPSAGAPAAGRIPVAAPSSAAGGAPSAPRIPAAPPPAASSAGRIPIPPPKPPAAAAAPSSAGKAALPPPSNARLPLPLPLPPTSMPRPAPSGPRPAAPSVPDKDSAPASTDPRPSVRPRAPLPLPSQLGRRGDGTKKE